MYRTRITCNAGQPKCQVPVLVSPHTAANLHPPKQYRLLRALASVEIRRGDTLRRDILNSMAGFAAYIGRSYRVRAWGRLQHCSRNGWNVFRQVQDTDAKGKYSPIGLAAPPLGFLFTRSDAPRIHQNQPQALKVL